MSFSAQSELKYVTALKTQTCQRYSQGSLSVLLEACVFLFSLYYDSVTEIENMAENVKTFLCLILQAKTAATE